VRTDGHADRLRGGSDTPTTPRRYPTRLQRLW
jgi:hypothetical protein